MVDLQPVVHSCGYNVCRECSFTKIEFNQHLSNKVEARLFLIAHGVLSCHSLCEKFQSRVSADFERNLFRCRKVIFVSKRGRAKCESSRSVFSGTFCDRMHLDLDKLCFQVDIFLSNLRSRTKEAMFELKLSSRTVIDWFSFCREVVADYVERNSHCIGGIGKIVEIHEAMLGKRKYKRGRMLTEQWVIGGVERGVRGECKAFFVPVENRTSETLIGIIRRYVLPGTTIMTDCWRGYNSLEDYGYRHFSVNHSENFVDPQTGANTQTIERLWVEVRRHVPKAGFRREALSGYLADVFFAGYLAMLVGGTSSGRRLQLCTLQTIPWHEMFGHGTCQIP
ncbi:uncharacterized protein LOC123671438 isoform X2 [Harmonia axyridis]|uniref:uncharacterized protein LOC123671438 isoform X2 n=1 Tax=Harmonia axyridis TaxID=115357 RepID=UPI001E27712B|nr:uncharacterized protein LOC123671438 isoform X2 [Harmonia axyridis]XP_045461254.1 uncharacterized protein LOC123671438 isoform X2 [Harmonia axyridis]